MSFSSNIPLLVDFVNEISENVMEFVVFLLVFEIEIEILMIVSKKPVGSFNL